MISCHLRSSRFPSLVGRRYLSTAPACVVGFLGLGNMGLPMAANLAKSRKVVAFDLNAESIEKAKGRGLETAGSVDDTVSGASIIVTMLPNDKALGAVMEKVLEKSPKGTTVIDCSTVGPATSRYWNDQMTALGGGFFDAPVSGGVMGAENATLTFMVGSTDEAMKEKVLPLLECMGKKIVACGGPGAGAAVKLCNNLALGTQMAGICEAMNLGESLGVDPVVLASVINTSTGKSWSCEVNNPHPAVAAVTGSPASKDYAGGFGTSLMLKDIGLAVEAGSEAHVSLPIGTATKDLYQKVQDSGLGNRDFGVLLKFLKEGK